MSDNSEMLFFTGGHHLIGNSPPPSHTHSKFSSFKRSAVKTRKVWSRTFALCPAITVEPLTLTAFEAFQIFRLRSQLFSSSLECSTCRVDLL